MIAYIIIITVVLTFVNYYYEMIVAPNIRLSIRYKLFDKRDQLRRYFIQNRNACSKSDFEEADKLVSNLINVLPAITITELLIHERKLNNDETYNKHIKSRISRLNRIEDEKIKNILNGSNSIAMKTLYVNMGMLSIYIIPLILVYLLFRKISGWAIGISNWTKNYIVDPKINIAKIDEDQFLFN